MQTPAWADLDTVARAAYLELHRVFNGTNNGRIALGVRTLADALNVSPKTASRALLSLESHGFITTMVRGAFHRKVRHASEYRITEFTCNVTGALASKEFAHWTKNNGARGDTERCT